MRRLPLILLLAVVVLAACRKVPDYVVPPDDMAAIMADMYVAKAVVEQNTARYPDDSSRAVLKQSVLAAHGVSLEQFDTSLVWYGHNPETYLTVYDKTVERLEDRSARLGSELVHAAMAMGGDSVELWPSSPYTRVSRLAPSRMIAFDIPADTSMRPGDVYTWRLKVLDYPHSEVRWNLYALYTDSTGDWLQTVATPGDPVGLWHEMVFPTDSTRPLSRLRGYLEVHAPDPAADVWVDSISLIRKPLSPERYQQRYRIRSHHAY